MENNRLHSRRQHSARAEPEQGHRRKLVLGIANRERKVAYILKLSIESGPERLRPSLSVTCREASDNCSNTEWKSIITSAWEPFSFNTSLLLRHNHHFKPPRIEFGAAYRTKSAFARLALSLPETSPAKAISVQNEIKFDGETLGCNFVFAFKKTKTKPFKPNFAHIQFFLKK